MSGPRYAPGAAVFLASAGLGRIVEFAGRDGNGKPAPLASGATPEFYVVEVGDTLACVPIDHADPLRPVVDPQTAVEMLEALRSPTPPASPPEPLLERGKRIVHSGSPLEHARFLRELYALLVPLSEPLASGLSFMSKLVLPEIASVSSLPLAALEQEMRQRYPAAQDAHEQQGLLRFHPP